jgi:hypothetical protein
VVGRGTLRQERHAVHPDRRSLTVGRGGAGASAEHRGERVPGARRAREARRHHARLPTRVERVEHHLGVGRRAHVTGERLVHRPRGHEHPDGRVAGDDDGHGHRLEEQRVAGDPEAGGHLPAQRRGHERLPPSRHARGRGRRVGRRVALREHVAGAVGDEHPVGAQLVGPLAGLVERVVAALRDDEGAEVGVLGEHARAAAQGPLPPGEELRDQVGGLRQPALRGGVAGAPHRRGGGQQGGGEHRDHHPGRADEDAPGEPERPPPGARRAPRGARVGSRPGAGTEVGAAAGLVAEAGVARRAERDGGADAPRRRRSATRWCAERRGRGDEAEEPAGSSPSLTSIVPGRAATRRRRLPPSTATSGRCAAAAARSAECRK